MKFSLLNLLGVGAIGVFATCDLCQTAGAVDDAVPPVVLAGPAATASGAGGLASAGAVAGVATPLPPAAAAGVHDADTARVTLSISGMTCGGCAIAARTMLSRLDGVARAHVNYESGTATVIYDRAKVSVDQMIAAVRKLGYEATLATR